MTGHTPTPGPWAVNEDRVESRHEHGWANDGWVICVCDGPDKLANAEFIVRAVNSHAPLLVMENAAGRVLDAVRDYLPPDGIGKDELISRVIEAVDNPVFNEALLARASNGGRDDG